MRKTPATDCSPCSLLPVYVLNKFWQKQSLRWIVNRVLSWWIDWLQSSRVLVFMWCCAAVDRSYCYLNTHNRRKQTEVQCLWFSQVHVAMVGLGEVSTSKWNFQQESAENYRPTSVWYIRHPMAMCPERVPVNDNPHIHCIFRLCSQPMDSSTKHSRRMSIQMILLGFNRTKLLHVSVLGGHKIYLKLSACFKTRVHLK